MSGDNEKLSIRFICVNKGCAGYKSAVHDMDEFLETEDGEHALDFEYDLHSDLHHDGKDFDTLMLMTDATGEAVDGALADRSTDDVWDGTFDTEGLFDGPGFAGGSTDC